MTAIIPVILCGGDGTRLWPISRNDFPKQFLKIGSKDSFLQQTLKRARALNPTEIIVLCNHKHRFLVSDQVAEIGESVTIILEPEKKDTAAAISTAAFYIDDKYHDDNAMLVMSSDHFIGNNDAFTALVEMVIQNVKSEDLLLSVAVPPTQPHTGYGYIEKGMEYGNTKIYEIEKFHEKPSLEKAVEYLQDQKYLWNCGIFIFNAHAFLHALKDNRENLYNLVKESFRLRYQDLNFLCLDKETFSKVFAESVDYAVMENIDNGLVAILDSVWSDIGSWDSMSEQYEADGFGNIQIGRSYIKDSTGCFVASTKKLVVAHGVKDLTIVETPDAILVQHKDYTQDTKKLVLDLVNAEFEEVTKTHEVHRPWGNYISLEFGDRFQVKKITVKPKQKLSLQMHHHRAEHWIVVSGTAKVTIGESEKILTENQSVYIPIAEVHCLENPGEIPLELIEVQSGSYLGEDDIVRFEDKYGRLK